MTWQPIGHTFDASSMSVGGYPVVDVRDAYTTRSTAERKYVAEHYVALVVDVSRARDRSETADMYACNLCNRVAPSPQAIEGHIRSEHVDGERRADAGKPVDTPEPASEEVMTRARNTLRLWRRMEREASKAGVRLTYADGARRLGISVDTLRRHLDLTAHLRRKPYNRLSAWETRQQYEMLRAARGGKITYTEAARTLGMSVVTLRRRLAATRDEITGADIVDSSPTAVAESAAVGVVDAGQGGDTVDTAVDTVGADDLEDTGHAADTDGLEGVGTSELAGDPVDAGDPSDAGESVDSGDPVIDPGEEDDLPPATGVIDPATETRLDATLDLIRDLHQSRAEWRARALRAEAALARARQALNALDS